MVNAYTAIEESIDILKRLRASLKKKRDSQVRNQEEITLIKTTVLTWFDKNRKKVDFSLYESSIQAIDDKFKELLECTQHHTRRQTYDTIIKDLLSVLIVLQKEVVCPTKSPSQRTTDQSPDFSKLITDAKMQQIMKRRWDECVKCLNADAPLASTVMMGGLLETLLLARINNASDKALVFKCKVAPTNVKDNNVLPLTDWSLKDYIDVCHEMKWICESAKDVSIVLRDYRNYIHPYKEYRHDKVLVKDDAELFWEIVKSLCRQVLS